jgi:hypothetical protein
MPPVYQLYGLRIASEVLLPASPGGGPPDLAVRWGPVSPVPAEPPAGTIVAEQLVDDRRLYTICADQGGYLIRFHGACDVHINAELSAVECRPDPGLDRELVGVLLIGTISAFVLSMRGCAVLHGSAVRIGGSVVGIIGPSGVGKSTVAALCCAAGATLLTDDVLPLELTVPPTCLGGWPELRLRPAASGIVELYRTRPETRPTADGRLGVRGAPDPGDRPPLAALLVPRPSRSATDVELIRVLPLQAVFLVLAAGRIDGWTEPSRQQAAFEVATQLARDVPTFTANIPWGPPFSIDVGDAVVKRLAGEVA